ncbi:MAG: hypothetical protein AAFP84_18025 [Actinomycetota bacterium]
MDEPPRSRRPLVALVAAASAGSIALWIVGLVRFRSWRANDDIAVFQLGLERFADGDVPLVGAYSRFGFHHPGPLREWVAGAAYWLSGTRAASLPSTALVLNLAAVLVALFAAHRALGRRGVAAAAAALALTQIGLADRLHSIWNPHLAILAGAAMAWGVVAVAVDGPRNWWTVVLPGSFLAQLHVSGTIALAAGIVVVAVVLVRAGDRRRLAVAAATTVLVWIGPLLDLTRGGDSNLAAFVDRSGGPTLGIVDSARTTLRLISPWSLASGDVVASDVEVAGAGWIGGTGILVVLAIAAGLLARDRRTRIVPVVGCAAAGVMWVLGAQLVTPVFPYLWAPLLGATTLLTSSIVLAAASVVTERIAAVDPPVSRAHLAGRVTAACAVGAAALSLVGWWSLAPIETASLQRTIEARVPTVVESGTEYSIRTGELIVSVAHAEVALAVQQAGGTPTSNIFELDLPAPPPDALSLVTAMGGSLDCLSAALDPSLLVLRHPSQPTGLDVGVFIAPTDDEPALERCGVER